MGRSVYDVRENGNGRLRPRNLHKDRAQLDVEILGGVHTEQRNSDRSNQKLRTEGGELQGSPYWTNVATGRGAGDLGCTRPPEDSLEDHFIFPSHTDPQAHERGELGYLGSSGFSNITTTLGSLAAWEACGPSMASATSLH